MATITFSGPVLSISFSTGGCTGFTLTHLSSGYTLTQGGCLSKVYADIEHQPTSKSTIPGGYRITYGVAYTADFAVEMTDYGMKLNIDSLSPDTDDVSLIEFSDLGSYLDPTKYSINDDYIIRLIDGFVLCVMPLTDSTAIAVRANETNHYCQAISRDPVNRDTNGGGSYVRNEGVYIVLCPEEEFRSVLASVEIELGLGTSELYPSLGRIHKYNNHDYLFVLGFTDELGQKISDEELIRWCQSMGIKQVMFYAGLWYKTDRLDSPYSLINDIGTTISRLKEAGISTVAHSYIRGPHHTENPRPFTGTWWEPYKDLLITWNPGEGNLYFPDIRNASLIETVGTAYADAIMEAGFDGIYWDGVISYSAATEEDLTTENPGNDCKPAIWGEMLGRYTRAIWSRFYANGFYPKVFQVGEESPFFYVTRTGQTDLWEGKENPRWGSVDEFIEDLNANAIRSEYRFPDFGWWGTIHSTWEPSGWRYATSEEWTKMTNKALADNIPIGYRTWYSGIGNHFDDPNKELIEQLLSSTIPARSKFITPETLSVSVINPSQFTITNKMFDAATFTISQQGSYFTINPNTVTLNSGEEATISVSLKSNFTPSSIRTLSVITLTITDDWGNEQLITINVDYLTFADFYQAIVYLYTAAIQQYDGYPVHFEDALKIVTDFDDEAKAQMFYQFHEAREEASATVPYSSSAVNAIRALQEYIISLGYTSIDAYIVEKGIVITSEFADISAAAGYVISPDLY